MIDFTHLGPYETAVQTTLTDLKDNNIAARIWQADHTVWRPDPTEINNRLGWLQAPEKMLAEADRLETFADKVKADGFQEVLLLGMGGSSLAPELYASLFEVKEGGLPLQIVDTTDATAILTHANRLDVSRTLFIVATKSGGTVETLSAFAYFYNLVAATVGMTRAGQHFVAITDPGSKLVTLAEKYNFRETFLNDPNIGGRYSALTLFGLVPAALVGVDLTRLLKEAESATRQGHGLRLGAALGALAQNGRDKLTLITSPQLASFADWIEQLIAESSGKEGKGIVPVVGESLAGPTVYGGDRVFVHLHMLQDREKAGELGSLASAGHPVIPVAWESVYDLGAQFFVWEMATAVVGHILEIHPFDQPNVESAKIMARQMVKAYETEGTLPASESTPLSGNAVEAFLAEATAGDYISLQAYVPPTPTTTALLHQLQTHLRDTYHLATTVGYGPRFLHSTGQLHKGDRGNGHFIQFVSAPQQDIAIPTQAGAFASTIDFGILKTAQALGDAAALQEAQRHLLRFEVGQDVNGSLESLLTQLAGKDEE